MADLYIKRYAEINKQMEDLLASQKNVYNNFLEKNEINIDANDLLAWKVKTKSLLLKSCGSDSEHYKEFISNEETGMYGTSIGTLKRLRAVFLAAREDYEGGYLRSARTLIQAEVFDSELEQAQALLNAGYKSAAAVIAGVVLETSLRELCDRQSIEHGKLDKMNSDLAKSGTYNKLQQKRITTIADVRNSAAHGKLEEFSDADVQDMIRDISRFIIEYL